jgi:23S rRNA pseudouridine2605 synthase
MERLHKFLARAGVDSRRACEELMLAGRVTVNGRVQRELGTQIDPDADDIRVDGEPVKASTELHYVLLHKPRGVITSMSDPEGRPTVADLVTTSNRMFPVGRLDFDSEGLLLMTDDGDLAYKLTHPSFQVEKEYHALLNEAPSVEQLRQWREGVELDDGRTAPAWVEALDETPDGIWVRVVIHEGRNRQVRRVAEALGLEVKRLVRLREGPLVLKDLPLGEWRPLTEGEISSLRIHAKQSRAWLPARPLPESPTDENPQERPRFQRIDRAGQPSQRRDEVGDPRDSQRGQRSLGGNRPLRRRGADEGLAGLRDAARAISEEQQVAGAEGAPPVRQVGGTLRRRDEGAGPRRDEGRPFNRDDRPRRDDERCGPRLDVGRPFTRDDRPRRDEDRGGFRRDEGRPFNRDDRPRRDDERGGFRRDERPRLDDDRGGFRRDERPRRDDDRGGPRRDEGRPFNRDDRPRRDDDRGGFRRDEGRPFNRDESPRREEGRGGIRRVDARAYNRD